MSLMQGCAGPVYRALVVRVSSWSDGMLHRIVPRVEGSNKILLYIHKLRDSDLPSSATIGDRSIEMQQCSGTSCDRSNVKHIPPAT